MLERAGIDAPKLLDHILLRVGDVMEREFPTARDEEAVRAAGLTMAREDRGYLTVVDGDGRVAGMMTERVLARKYIRESRGASNFADGPVRVSLILDVLEGELVCGDDREIDGRLWVGAVSLESMPEQITEGDIVVVGDRPDIQRFAIEAGVALLALSHSKQPDDEIRALADERGTTIVSSPLDSYVTGRMISLAVPARSLMDPDPLTVRPDDLVQDIAPQVRDVGYRAGIVIDEDHRPVGLITRSSLVNPTPRKVLLVDHAEAAQSVPGVETAEIVEILDHHHIGSIETRLPVPATFDPVGSTATLVVERFRQNGMEPSPPTATMLLGGVLSDTVVLSSPTTTDRDRAVVEYLERILTLDAQEWGREMFESTSDVSNLPASEIINRDAKEYTIGGGRTIAIAQIETVGTQQVLARKDELLEAMEAVRDNDDHLFFALMVTDIVEGATELLVAGDMAPVERTFEIEANDSVLTLPGVMSRKKQVAPKLLSVL